MGIRKYIGIVRAAGRDAAEARSTSHTKEFRKAVSKDRRGALSEYTTVKQALRDRERLAAAKSRPKKTKPTRVAGNKRG